MCNLLTYQINQYDPTRTTSLRNAFVRQMNKRFRELRGVIRKSIVEQDCFGLVSNLSTQQMQTAGRKAFAFPTSSAKVSSFMKWLQVQIDNGILQVSNIDTVGQSVNSAWSNLYIYDSYKRGILRANYEMKKAGYKVASIEQQGGIEAVMGTPLSMDRVGLLYLRTYNDLKGITDAMSGQISRVLAQGMADGDGPLLLARKLNRVISGMGEDLGIKDTLGRFIPARRRAEILARTEIIRAHHKGTMQEYRNWKMEGVVVKAEFRTAGDKRVCDICAGMEGNVYTLDKAEGIIPVHPQCRCIMLPFRPGTDEPRRWDENPAVKKGTLPKLKDVK